MPESPSLRPGFVVLHGNRIEDLAAVALDWLARHPLGPLDEETLLVPSSGMAEWLKATMAERLGVAAGFRIELPAQFGWRAWRAVLGAAAVPAASTLDKGPLTWPLPTSFHDGAAAIQLVRQTQHRHAALNRRECHNLPPALAKLQRFALLS